MSNTLGEESYTKPWLEIRAQYNKLQTLYPVFGRVIAGSYFTFIGSKILENAASFIVFGYGFHTVYIVNHINDEWSYSSLKNPDSITIF